MEPAQVAKEEWGPQLEDLKLEVRDAPYLSQNPFSVKSITLLILLVSDITKQIERGCSVKKKLVMFSILELLDNFD